MTKPIQVPEAVLAEFAREMAYRPISGGRLEKSLAAALEKTFELLLGDEAARAMDKVFGAIWAEDDAPAIPDYQRAQRVAIDSVLGGGDG